MKTGSKTAACGILTLILLGSPVTAAFAQSAAARIAHAANSFLSTLDVIEYSPQPLGGDLAMHVHTIYRDPANDYGRKPAAK